MIETARIRREKAVATPPVQRDYRKELWIEVCVAVARAENSRDGTVPAAWADASLKRFDQRFPEAA
jgi:hypothetical protein